MKRKIIQVAVADNADFTYEDIIRTKAIPIIIIALCDDGTLWNFSKGC